MKVNKLIITMALCIACQNEPPEPKSKRIKPDRHVTSFVTNVISNNSIEVTWDDVVDADKYIVQAKTGSGDFELVTDGILIEDDTDWSNESAVDDYLAVKVTHLGQLVEMPKAEVFRLYVLRGSD